MIMRRVATVFVALGGCMLSHAAPQYHVTVLDPLPGYVDAIPTAINDAGVAVGNCYPLVQDFNNIAVKWNSQTPTSLGLPVSAGGQYSYVSTINNSGLMAGEADDGSIRPQTVVFSGPEPTFIDSGANNSRAMFVSNRGQVFGNWAKGFGGGGWLPTLWTLDPDHPGRYRHTFLPRFLEEDGSPAYSYLFSANNKGEAVGNLNSTLWSSRGALWHEDAGHTLEILEPPAEFYNCYAYAINDRGDIVGTSDTGVFSSGGTLWRKGMYHKPESLKQLYGTDGAYANGINNAGQIIGACTSGNNSASCIWIKGQPYRLQDCLDGSGAGITVVAASDINELGEIVATGLINGRYRGLILRPIQP